MSSAVKTIFGGTDDSAQKAQTRANKRTEERILELQEQSRQDALPLFDASRQNINQGAQGALDLIGQGIPQETGVFQQGNVAAQQALLAGLPQVQNAIMGQPVDLGGLQAQQLNFNPGFGSNVQLPQQPVPNNPAAPIDPIAQILGGKI